MYQDHNLFTIYYHRHTLDVNNILSARLEVLTAVITKMAVFWVVAPCSVVEVYQHFRSPCCLIALMMEAVRTSETMVNLYQTTWRYNPEDNHLQSPLRFEK
jgi:hypothetical protein